MRLLIVLAVFVLAALHAPPVASQTRPGFWEVSARAAAEAGLDSAVAPIILDNALSVAEEYDANGTRPILSRVELMLAYVAAGKFDLYTKRFGSAGFNIDTTKFDRGMRDYLATLRSLQDTYYKRWRDPHPDEQEGVRFEALGYAAENFANIEVKLRQKIASDDTLALAHALNERGLVFGHRGDRRRSTDDFKEALRIYATTRRGMTAMARADRAFSLNENHEMRNQNAATASTDDVDNFTLSSDEQYIFSVMLTLSIRDLDNAISLGHLTEASDILATLDEADARENRINLFMLTKWPCHQNNSVMHLARAMISVRKMQIERKTHGPSSPAVEEYFEQADLEYRKCLEIELFSDGLGEHLTVAGQYYVDFLNEAGRGVDASRIEASIKSLRPADIGTSGPKAWQDAVDCAGDGAARIGR